MSEGPPTLAQRVGARVRVLREQRGLTQEALGVRAGFSGKYISEIERGLRDLPLSSLAAVTVRGLGADLAQVFGSPVPEPGYRAGEESVAPPYGMPPLPGDIDRLARRVTELPLPRRRQVLAVLRLALALACESQHQ